MKPKLTIITTKPDPNKVNRPYKDMVMAAFDRLEANAEQAERRKFLNRKSNVQMASKRRL